MTRLRCGGQYDKRRTVGERANGASYRCDCREGMREERRRIVQPGQMIPCAVFINLHACALRHGCSTKIQSEYRRPASAGVCNVGMHTQSKRIRLSPLTPPCPASLAFAPQTLPLHAGRIKLIICADTIC